MNTFLAYTTQILLIVLSLFLILIVLLQRGRGGGLAGALGGAGGQSAFGTRAGDVFTKITIGVAAVWFLLAGFSGNVLRASSGEKAENFAPAEVEDVDDVPGLGDPPQVTAPDAPGVPRGEDEVAPLIDLDAESPAKPDTLTPSAPELPEMSDDELEAAAEEAAIEEAADAAE